MSSPLAAFTSMLFKVEHAADSISDFAAGRPSTVAISSADEAVNVTLLFSDIPYLT